MADDQAVENAEPEKAIEEINRGLETLKGLFIEHEAEDQYEEDELVVRLVEFQNSIRENYDVGLTLVERLDKAVADEDYEKAARLRDQLERREKPSDVPPQELTTSDDGPSSTDDHAANDDAEPSDD
jgi:cysteinyl-tRNA synthetase